MHRTILHPMPSQRPEAQLSSWTPWSGFCWPCDLWYFLFLTCSYDIALYFQYIIIYVQALYGIFQLFSEEKTWTPLCRVSCSSSAPGRPQNSTSSSKAPAEAQTEPHLIPSYRAKCAQICSKWMHGLHMWSLHLHILEIFGPLAKLKDMLRHLRTLGVFLQHVDSP